MRRPPAPIPVLVFLAVAGWAVACGDGATEPPAPEPPRATTLTVTPATAGLTALGETVRLAAEVRDQNGRAMARAAVTWSSGDASVATVDATGLVTAAANGTATITATSGSASGSAAVTVAQAVSAVAVSPAVDSLVAGDTLRLVAEATDVNGQLMAVAEFTWSSSNVSVARVDGSGLVTGTAEGTATVTATAGSASGSATVTVLENPDRAALAALYHATDGPNWVNNENWLTDAPLGEWYGVDTDASGRVTRIVLKENALAGPMPPELGDLTSLRRLDFTSNGLTGSIPAELGSLANLEFLNLPINNLAGPLPPELGGLANLWWLQLATNALEGPLPPEWDGLTKLQELYIFNNELSGPLPRSLFGLDDLVALSFGSNAGLCAPGTTDFVDWIDRLDFSNGPYCNESDRSALRTLFETAGGSGWSDSAGWLGSVALDRWHGIRADSLGRVTALDLGSNGLAGRLPPDLGDLARMTELRIGSNADLTGRLPLSLADLSLRVLRYMGTGLCTPAEPAFREWLTTIPSHEGTARECSPQSDRAVLEALYDATGGANWNTRENWLSDRPLGEWYGVTTDDAGSVTGLSLYGNNLAGVIPRDIGSLASLRRLDLARNSLTGPIPSELGNLSELTRLRLDENDFSGPIPSELGDLANLVGLSLIGRPFGQNALTGSIPPELGSLANLTLLNLSRNRLSGPIPPELGSLVNLTSLNLHTNGLSGPIPPELGSLSNLTWLDLSWNRLSGPIPPELGNLANLRTLGLGGPRYSGLPGLSGPIPSELGNLTELTWLELGGNDLTGRIPPELGNLANLQQLRMHDNSLTGAIPGKLGDLANLTRLLLQENALTGAIPGELGSLDRLEELHLSGNALAGSVPPEFGGLVRLRVLGMSRNSDLSGPLPISLADLRNLETLQAASTRLCAPSDAAFLNWLDGIPNQRVARCGNEATMAYLVQAVQSREFPVPLISGEEALLRVFITAARANDESLPPVRASFYLNGAVAHVADIPAKQGPIPTEVDEGSLVRSANATVPAEVVRPGLELVVEIDPDQTLDPALGVATRIPETGRVAIDVRAMPVLDLTLIPFLWAEAPDSAVVESVAGMASNPAGHELLWHTRTLLPVGDLQATAHEPVVSSSNKSLDLMRQTAAIRAMEDGTGHWIGLMGPRITGLGNTPGRISVSPPNSFTIAHELGHNMSLRHAPCGITGDPAYPHENGIIGSWGYDRRGVGRIVPPDWHDLMSYCSPTWISDYNFNKAIRYRLADEGAPDAADMAAAASLLLWGGVDATGLPYLEPAFVVDAPPALPDSAGEYTIRGRSGEGAELFSLAFAMPDTGEASSSFAFALPVLSGWDRSLASITLSGPSGSVTLDRDTDRPLAILRNPRNGQVRGFLRDPPPATQAVADTVAQGVGTRLEVLFSRGIPGAEAWRRR